MLNFALWEGLSGVFCPPFSAVRDRFFSWPAHSLVNETARNLLLARPHVLSAARVRENCFLLPLMRIRRCGMGMVSRCVWGGGLAGGLGRLVAERVRPTDRDVGAVDGFPSVAYLRFRALAFASGSSGVIDKGGDVGAWGPRSRNIAPLVPEK